MLPCCCCIRVGAASACPVLGTLSIGVCTVVPCISAMCVYPSRVGKLLRVAGKARRPGRIYGSERRVRDHRPGQRPRWRHYIRIPPSFSANPFSWRYRKLSSGPRAFGTAFGDRTAVSASTGGTAFLADILKRSLETSRALIGGPERRQDGAAPVLASSTLNALGSFSSRLESFRLGRRR